jgi:hypothetical protein
VVGPQLAELSAGVALDHRRPVYSEVRLR